MKAEAEAPNSAIYNEETQMVSIQIPADEGIKDERYQYIEVGLNGKMYMVARGRTVDVPVSVYEVLKLSGRFPLSA
jgi:hypothetical protein